MGNLQLRPEELQQLMSKDQPEKLGEKVLTLVKKLKFVSAFKESELREKKIKLSEKRELIKIEEGGSAAYGVPQLKEEIEHYK
jgi:hypothetical protein